MGAASAHRPGSRSRCASAESNTCRHAASSCVNSGPMKSAQPGRPANACVGNGGRNDGGRNSTMSREPSEMYPRLARWHQAHATLTQAPKQAQHNNAFTRQHACFTHSITRAQQQPSYLRLRPHLRGRARACGPCVRVRVCMRVACVRVCVYVRVLLGQNERQSLQINSIQITSITHKTIPRDVPAT